MTATTTAGQNISLHDLIAAIAADYGCGHDRATDVVNHALGAYEKEGHRGVPLSDETLGSAGEEAVRLRADRLLDALGFSNETHTDRCRTVIRAHPTIHRWEVTVYQPSEDVYDELRTADTYARAEFTAALQRSKHLTRELGPDLAADLLTYRLPDGLRIPLVRECHRVGKHPDTALVNAIREWIRTSQAAPSTPAEPLHRLAREVENLYGIDEQTAAIWILDAMIVLAAQEGYVGTAHLMTSDAHLTAAGANSVLHHLDHTKGTINARRIVGTTGTTASITAFGSSHIGSWHVNVTVDNSHPYSPSPDGPHGDGRFVHSLRRATEVAESLLRDVDERRRAAKAHEEAS